MDFFLLLSDEKKCQEHTELSFNYGNPLPFAEVNMNTALTLQK